MNLRLFAVSVLLLAVSHVHAHPGHHPTDHGVSHLLASPYHLFTLAAVALVLFGLARFVAHRIAARVLFSAGATALTAVLLAALARA